MRLNNFLRIFVLFLIVCSASVFSTILSVSAQYDVSSIEEQLELAKEKVAGILSEPDQTYSNLTLAQFPTHLSNMTLSQEQVTEIEKDQSAIFMSCIDRISQKEQPGKLCDAFADYLMEKCDKFDNLLAYCLGSTLGKYESLRNLQLSCSKIPPSYSDIGRINNCLTVLQLNSSYTDRLNSYTDSLRPPTIPLKLSATITEKTPSNIRIRFVADNPNHNPIDLVNITYVIFEKGNKLSEGCIAVPVPCWSPPSQNVEPLSSVNYDIKYSLDAAQNQTLNGPFAIKGTYYFHFANSKITGQNFNYKLAPNKCEIIDVNC